ncbi:MAG TPA: ABC transporter permease [Chitinophagaceae bacterium]|mgnify:FL=1|nr:ABC transporter permease [Chitinophagaceae bacterium]
MKRIIATFIKEWHLMRRDIGGISLVFLMPIILVIIMALVQDAPFKDFKEIKFKTLVVDHDQSAISAKIINGLKQSNQFEMSTQELSLEEVKQVIKNGKFNFAVIIKKGVGSEIVNSGNIIANQIAAQIGIHQKMPHREQRDSNQIDLMFDPISKPTFKIAIHNALEKLVEKIQSEIILERISAIQPQKENTDSLDFQKILGQVKVNEIGTGTENAYIQKINSVQHNVPSWSIFGIFFMVLVISESLITERNTGSWTRIKLIQGSLFDIFVGKILFFILLGIIQFYFMLLVGVYLMPLLGLDALVIGTHQGALFLMVSSISLCAASVGILFGMIFNSTNQALPVGAISVVILSAVGGVWVPLEILPPLLSKISYISPLRWSLEGINNILLRNGGLSTILIPSFALVLVSAISLLISKLMDK